MTLVNEFRPAWILIDNKMKHHLNRLLRQSNLAFFVAAMLAVCSAAHGQTILKQFAAPGPEVRGLAWDGQYLWCADATNDKIYKIDPESGEVVYSFDFTLDYLYGGLCWSPDGYLWVTDFRDSYSWLLKVDPDSGTIESAFHCPGG
jgi:streptogramin lyase